MATKVALSPESWKSEQACWGINVYNRVNINKMEQDYKYNIYSIYFIHVCAWVIAL